MKKIFLSLAVIGSVLFQPTAYGQQEATAVTSTEKTLTFPNPADKKKNIGTIKFEETKEHVVALYEGVGLKKGKYSISKIQKCKVGASVKLDSSHEILNFETVSGDSSTEKNLTEAKLADLLLDQNQVALLKTDKKSGTIVSCATE